MIFFVWIQYFSSSFIHMKYASKTNYRLYRFEDLVSKPVACIRDLCDFLDIEFTKGMLYPGKGQKSSVTNSRTDYINPKVLHQWVGKITAPVMLITTLLTRGSMKRLGYHPKFLYFKNKF